jgi:hypothetical protein
MSLSQPLKIIFFFEIKDEKVLERTLELDLLGSLERLALSMVKDLDIVSSVDLDSEIIE